LSEGTEKIHEKHLRHPVLRLNLELDNPKTEVCCYIANQLSEKKTVCLNTKFELSASKILRTAGFVIAPTYARLARISLLIMPDLPLVTGNL
jgi:hypothetical protein